MVVDEGVQTNLGVNIGASGSRSMESVELEARVADAVDRAESPRSAEVGDEVEAARR